MDIQVYVYTVRICGKPGPGNTQEAGLPIEEARVWNARDNYNQRSGKT